MADTYQQPRKSKNSDDDTGKALKLIGGGALGTLATGSAGILAQRIADKMYPMTSQKYQERTTSLNKKTTPPGRGGGGGGGTYNVAQPIADKNLMNKYGKKLK